MFCQEKEYIQLFRGNEKLMTAGLCKQVVWDQKIKIDYYLDHLPVAEGAKGQIHLLYLVRQEGENGLIKKEAVEKIIFSKSKLHYSVTKREASKYQIVKIDTCYIEFEGDYHIQLQSKIRTVTPQNENMQATDISQNENMRATDTSQNENMRVADTSQNENMQAMDTSQELAAAKMDADEKIDEQPIDTPKKTVSEKKDEIRRIDDLKVFLQLGEDFVELYYNSFLLHSFYQYRHVLLAKNFIGVPDYFYEREAIAAKMMGFPYFVEAKNIDDVCFDYKCTTNMPKDGTYGYFLRKI